MNAGATAPEVFVTTGEGRTLTLVAPPGATLMEVLRDSGETNVMALCGGGCACATCHVLVDPDQLALLPAMTADEAEMLEAAPDRGPGSRLSCQIDGTQIPQGLRLTLPEGG